MIELLNDCVIFPHPINWDELPRWTRQRKTNISDALTKSEDRTNPTSRPMIGFEYGILPFDTQDRAILTARVLEAMRRGRAVVPLWGRPSYIITSSLSQDFVDLDAASVYPFRPNDYVFFSKPVFGENRAIQINAGGNASDAYVADTMFANGAADTPTAAAINVAGIVEPAPQAAYQTRRKFTKVPGTDSMYYTITGLNPKVECRIRLHFAQTDHAVNTTSNRETFDISIEGAGISQLNGWNTLDFIAAYDRATIQDFYLFPDSSGTIVIRFTPGPLIVGNLTATINAIDVFQWSWEIKQLNAATNQRHLAFDSLIKPTTRFEDRIYPVIFGTPTIKEQIALTPTFGPIRIRVDEPIGFGDAGAVCPSQTCHFDPPLLGETPPPPPVDEGTMTCSTGVPGFWSTVDYPNPDDPSGTRRPLGISAASKEEAISNMQPGVAEWWAGQVWAQWSQYRTDNPGVVMSGTPRLGWDQGGTSSSRYWNANAAYSIPGTYGSYTTGSYWFMTVEFCG